ncbi:MAG: hypothetical protein A2W76_00240 [Gammaproteobacteria bacterium RIFCSPLOWO2_12_47_11]|nr:MAG: hypothetical protein A2W76_00240 [Gammaproteobacteria bacterium RIFCSPLOWO2_12_47_11]
MSAVIRLRFVFKFPFSFIFPILNLAFVTSVQAVEFDYGDVYGSFDTTVSYGQSHRVQSRASELIGIANGGSAFSVNGDDGNLNYDSGLISSTLKFTSELELHYKNFGAFLRGTGFRDFMNDDPNDTVRTPLSSQAIDLVGKDLKLLDAYMWTSFDLGTRPFDLRVGKQVLSWGESTFIQNSINTINPVDVSKLRVPGAELKEALLPVGIVSASAGITDTLNLEAFYQYDYERVLIDPPGSYFSTNDFVGNGGTFVVAAGAGFFGDLPPIPGTFATRAPDDRPEEGGQYGVALRWFSSLLNNTEFGFYHINYHSRLPIINGVVSTFGAGITGAQYLISYPEDITLYGLSFNTQLGTTGWALQGEYSFRNDVPLQVDDVELLVATINAGIPSQIPGSGLFAFAPGQVVPGFIRRDVSQLQMTASRVFGPMLKANQAIFVTEFAVTHVHDMPGKDVLLLEAPGTNLTGNPANRPFLGHPFVESRDKYADATSWGYRMVGRLDYNNVVGAINLHPRIEWRHDVSGNSPGPGGNFVEGNKAVTAGLGASYQNAWQADLSYTSFFGAGSQNLLYDRDFLSLSVSYSF